jgi:1-acyl-sn-glycerol-3-phosphate acyltransferase
MRNIFAQTMLKALKLRSEGASREDLAYRVLPSFLLDIITRYLRVDAEGFEHIPKRGPVIVIANHSGYMGFDALMLGHQIFQRTKRLPRIIAHKMWFLRPEIAVPAKKMGMVPATLDNGLKILQKKQMLLLFPEGEEGNFKPTIQAYKLKRFRRGFVRLALKTGAPIVPAVVIGAEETSITLGQIRWAKEILGIIIPVPLNVIPLPARWAIKFGEPIVLEKDPEKAEDIEYVTKLSKHIRTQLQKQLNDELRKRKTIFI